MAGIRRAGMFLVLVFLAAGCGGGGTSGTCDICGRMASMCDRWDRDDEDKCVLRCQRNLEHPARCDALYETARACFSDAGNWDCESSRGLVGCDTEMEAYLACKTGQWTPMNALPAPVTALVADPGRPGAVYAAAGEEGSVAVYLSEDRGASWSPISADLPTWYVTAMAVGPGDPPRLVAAESFNVCVSADGGVHWEQHRYEPWNPRAVLQLAMASPDGQQLYALVSEKGFFASDNGGLTWTERNQGLPHSDFGTERYYSSQTMVVDPSDPSVIYLGTGQSHLYSGFEDGVYKSVDAGLQWTPANQGIEGFTVTRLHAPTSRVIYAAADSIDIEEAVKALQSRDAGASWEVILGEDPDFYHGVAALAADPDDPEEVYLVLESLEVLARSQNGAVWRLLVASPQGGLPLMTSADETSLVVLFGEPDVLLVGCRDGAWRYQTE